MPERTLRDCRILVAEDEYMLADELCAELVDVGAVVLGPAGTLEDALDLISANSHIDGAILDVNLQGKMIFPAADLLGERKVPVVFTTGYDASVIPSRFLHVARCEKPVNIVRVTQAIGRAVHGEQIEPKSSR